LTAQPQSFDECCSECFFELFLHGDLLMRMAIEVPVLL
jgi:hypothetical protein